MAAARPVDLILKIRTPSGAVNVGVTSSERRGGQRGRGVPACGACGGAHLPVRRQVASDVAQRPPCRRWFLSCSTPRSSTRQFVAAGVALPAGGVRAASPRGNTRPRRSPTPLAPHNGVSEALPRSRPPARRRRRPSVLVPERPPEVPQVVQQIDAVAEQVVDVLEDRLRVLELGLISRRLRGIEVGAGGLPVGQGRALRVGRAELRSHRAGDPLGAGDGVELVDDLRADRGARGIEHRRAVDLSRLRVRELLDRDAGIVGDVVDRALDRDGR